jgi:hypothetical protein
MNLNPNNPTAMRQSHLGAALAGALLLSAGALQAQSAARPVEMGIDMGIAFTLDDPKTTSIALPSSSLRAGFFLNERVSIEPALGLQHVSVSGGGSATQFDLAAGALFHLSPDRARSQMYLRPFLGFTSLSGGGESASQAALGFGFGTKLPLRSHLAARFEGRLAHGFETSKLPGQTALGLGAGLSFFTR